MERGRAECDGKDAELDGRPVEGRREHRREAGDHPPRLRRHPLPGGRRGLHDRLRPRGRGRRHSPSRASAANLAELGAADTSSHGRDHDDGAGLVRHDRARGPDGHHRAARPRRPPPRRPPPAEPCAPSCWSGGSGTRLRPLTDTRPKQMLPIVDRPMIERVVDHLADHGVDDVVLSLGYRPDAFPTPTPTGPAPASASTTPSSPSRSTPPAPSASPPATPGIDERFLVLNGDVLTDLDVTGFVAFHEAAGAEGTIALHQVDDPSRYGVVPTDGDGRVVAFVEKPPPARRPPNWINAGTYVLEPSVLDRIPSRPQGVDRAGGVPGDGGRRRAVRRRRRRPTGSTPAPPRRTSRPSSTWSTGCGASRARACTRRPEVDPEATVERSVVGAGATVAAGARVGRVGAAAGRPRRGRRASSTARWSGRLRDRRRGPGRRA